MNRRRIGHVVMFAAALVAGGPRAVGELITWEFTGEVTHIWDLTDLLGGAVALGDPFSGSFTFESTTPDADPADARIGLYEGAIGALSGQFGELPVTGVFGGTNYIEVINPSTIGPDAYHAGLDV